MEKNYQDWMTDKSSEWKGRYLHFEFRNAGKITVSSAACVRISFRGDTPEIFIASIDTNGNQTPWFVATNSGRKDNRFSAEVGPGTARSAGFPSGKLSFRMVTLWPPANAKGAPRPGLLTDGGIFFDRVE